jgi:hypothetical protein
MATGRMVISGPCTKIERSYCGALGPPPPRRVVGIWPHQIGYIYQLGCPAGSGRCRSTDTRSRFVQCRASRSDRLRRRLSEPHRIAWRGSWPYEASVCGSLRARARSAGVGQPSGGLPRRPCRGTRRGRRSNGFSGLGTQHVTAAPNDSVVIPTWRPEAVAPCNLGSAVWLPSECDQISLVKSRLQYQVSFEAGRGTGATRSGCLTRDTLTI